MKIRKIRWRDSRMYIAQVGNQEPFDVTVIESVGFVLEDTPDHVTLAGDMVDTEFRRVIVIPRENIIGSHEKTTL